MDILEKIEKLELEATEFGFQWESAEQIMAQIRSECSEIEEHLQALSPNNSAALQEEIGDLLHAVFSLCVFCQFSAKETLQESMEKFERRLEAVKTIAAEKKLKTLQGKAFNELMNIWDEAKTRVG